MSTEEARLAALQAMDILDTSSEDHFDQLADLAAEIMDTPIALVSLVDRDRQWFKARHGLNAVETPRDWSFCDHAVQAGPMALLVVEDATLDPRFASNPLVTGEMGLRFYAGAVLTDSQGHNLGALCAIDTKPRPRPSDRKLNRLRILADLVVKAMEQRLMGRQLEEKQRLIDLAEHMSGVGHWRVTPASQTVEWSDEVYRIYGLSRETFTPTYGQGIELHSPAEMEDLGRKFQAALTTGKAFEYKGTVPLPDGSFKTVVGKSDSQRDKFGNVVSLVGVLQDVTQYEEALAAAREAVAAKSAFLANMTHEIRTPLTSIIGYSELAASRSTIDEMTRQELDRVKTAGKALLATVNDILDFSKLEAGLVTFKKTPVRLGDLVQQTFDLLEIQAAAKDLVLDLSIDQGADGPFEMDGDRVRQVLINLIMNAVKFTTAGGVTVRLSRDLAAGKVRIEVRDTGPGISEEGQARLFQRFSQIDSVASGHGGTGLGLAICQGLVTAMGGELGVQSSLGQGSCFWFELPAETSAQGGESSPSAAQLRKDLTGLRILVADDHTVNRELAKVMLASAGAEVTTVVDGAEAVIAAQSQRLDAILLDIRMPILGGVEACAQIRESGASFPILAFTAEAENCGVVLEPGVAFDGVVTKPIHLASMVATICDALQPSRRPVAEAVHLKAAAS